MIACHLLFVVLAGSPPPSPAQQAASTPGDQDGSASAQPELQPPAPTPSPAPAKSDVAALMEQAHRQRHGDRPEEVSVPTKPKDAVVPIPGTDERLVVHRIWRDEPDSFFSIGIAGGKSQVADTSGGRRWAKGGSFLWRQEFFLRTHAYLSWGMDAWLFDSAQKDVAHNAGLAVPVAFDFRPRRWFHAFAGPAPSGRSGDVNGVAWLSGEAGIGFALPQSELTSGGFEIADLCQRFHGENWQTVTVRVVLSSWRWSDLR